MQTRSDEVWRLGGKVGGFAQIVLTEAHLLRVRVSVRTIPPPGEKRVRTMPRAGGG